MAQAEVDDNGSVTPLASKEKKELAELRRDKRRLALIIRGGCRHGPGLGFGDLHLRA
jgi:hypothetical protein